MLDRLKYNIDGDQQTAPPAKLVVLFVVVTSYVEIETLSIEAYYVLQE